MVVELLAGTVNACLLGVGASVEVGDIESSPEPVMIVLGAGGTIERPGAPLLLEPSGWAWGVCISGLTVAVDAA